MYIYKYFLYIVVIRTLLQFSLSLKSVREHSIVNSGAWFSRTLAWDIFRCLEFLLPGWSLSLQKELKLDL